MPLGIYSSRPSLIFKCITKCCCIIVDHKIKIIYFSLFEFKQNEDEENLISKKLELLLKLVTSLLYILN